MKIIAADIILLIVGLLLFGGSVAGLLATGGLETVTQQGSSTGLFNLTFATANVDAGTKTVGAYSSGSQEFKVTQTNITKVTFAVQCTDPAAAGPAGYQVTVAVTGPNGLKSGPTARACGSAFTIDVAVSPVPEGGAVAGDTEAEARANIENDANATKATGTWTVTYTGARQTAPIPPATGAIVPSGSIKLTLSQWTANLVPQAR